MPQAPDIGARQPKTGNLEEEVQPHTAPPGIGTEKVLGHDLGPLGFPHQGLPGEESSPCWWLHCSNGGTITGTPEEAELPEAKGSPHQYSHLFRLTPYHTHTHAHTLHKDTHTGTQTHTHMHTCKENQMHKLNLHAFAPAFFLLQKLHQPFPLIPLPQLNVTSSVKPSQMPCVVGLLSMLLISLSY